jgi:hypothetical protein
MPKRSKISPKQDKKAKKNYLIRLCSLSLVKIYENWPNTCQNVAKLAQNKKKGQKLPYQTLPPFLGPDI